MKSFWIQSHSLYEKEIKEIIDDLVSENFKEIILTDLKEKDYPKAKEFIQKGKGLQIYLVLGCLGDSETILQDLHKLIDTFPNISGIYLDYIRYDKFRIGNIFHTYTITAVVE